MAYIDFMSVLHKNTKRDYLSRVNDPDFPKARAAKLAKQWGYDYWDGDRRINYGGYQYIEGRWENVAQEMVENYDLPSTPKILDIGCGKGFLLFDFLKLIPDAEIFGIDISEYAIKNSMEDTKRFLSVGNAKDLSIFDDKEFDLVISINTVHNLELNDCKQAIKEIQRVGKNSFIVNDAWNNDEEKEKMIKWNLTGRTFMHVDDWKKLFDEIGYTGDYYWFKP